MPTTLFDLIFQNRSKFGEIIPKSFFQKPHREINFSEEFLKFLKKHPKLKVSAKDAIDPVKCSKLIKKIHKELGLDWSYGGYLENRSFILKNSYLKTTQSWIHLGIDISVPAKTPISAALDGTIYMFGSDYSKGGWGNFIILRHQIDNVTPRLRSGNIYLPNVATRKARELLETKVIFYSIYGHLADRALPEKGQKVKTGEVLGLVGKPVENGRWWPHVHFQFISDIEMKAKEIPFTLDGYGKQKDIEYLRMHYPDPLVALPMGHKD